MASMADIPVNISVSRDDEARRVVAMSFAVDIIKTFTRIDAGAHELVVEWADAFEQYLKEGKTVEQPTV